jgi:hypothetical protein
LKAFVNYLPLHQNFKLFFLSIKTESSKSCYKFVKIQIKSFL